MRFRKIKFHNYRCFIDGELSFNENRKKHINLILGNNGAGKTESLFAFWWVLYGFDFKTLNNKEATPYALNASLYKSLEADIISEAECKVTLEIENNGVTRIVERTAYYTKNNNVIEVEEKQSLRKYKPNFELTTPETDHERIEAELNRIVPKRILYGIVFDGERMKQLSSENEQSIEAIKGVISDITNIELLERCKENYSGLQRKYAQKIKNLARQRGKFTLGELIANIQRHEKELEDNKNELEDAKYKLEAYQREAEQLSKQLVGIRATQELEQQRKIKKADLKKVEQKRLDFLNSFPGNLKDGYYLCSQKLFEDVNSLLTKYDVPAGLTVPAVNNILKRKTCICGNYWTKEMIDCLNKLKRTLPPDNINSTLGEMVRQKMLYCESIRNTIVRESQTLSELDKSITDLKDLIASLTTRIANSDSELVKDIEKKNNEAQRQIGIYSDKKQKLEKIIPDLEKILEKEKEERDNYQDNGSEIDLLNKKLAFTDKCIKALNLIKITNQKTALKQINEILGKSYELLSDDADMGRGLYITQYDNNNYRMISYLHKKLEAKIKELQKKGIYQDMVSAGLTEEQIREQAILKCQLPNSTGQSKMNTLAFVKAILDYSNQKRADESIQVTKEYPLLIDAPFGDIFEENLKKSALALNDFTHQIILMVAEDSYRSVENFIKDGVNTVHVLKKVKDEDRSIVKKC